MATKAIIRSAVLSAASENSALLNRLSATSEAPSIIRSHALHISRLEGLLSEQDQLIQSLKSTVESRFRSHKKLRDSKLRRLYLRATGMLDAFEVRAMATEREYFVMLANQSKAEERQREIRRDLEGAVQAQKPLEQAAKEHEQVHERIDALYEGLFAGPTPGFDREDEKEMAFYTARERNDATKEKILGARRVLKLLGHVTRCLNRAEHHIKTAEQEADNSTFFFADARRILSGSTGYITSAISAIDRAGEVLGELAPDMRAVRLLIHQQLLDAQRQSEAQTSPDAMIAAIFTAKVRVAEAKESANRFQELAKQREQASLEEIKTTARQLEDRRQALYQIRLGIFEDVAGFGEAAPPYTECCDRSSSFCRVPDELHDDDVGLVEMADGPESLCGRTSQSTLPAYGYSLPLVTTTLELPPPRRDAQLLAEKPPAFGVNGTKVGNL